MIFSNKIYDVLKFIALIVLPAFAALYLGLAGLWDLPKANEVGGTAALLAAFIGALLQISNAKYKNSDASVDGSITATGVDELSGNPDLAIKIKDPNELLDKKTAKFAVTNKIDEIEEH